MRAHKIFGAIVLTATALSGCVQQTRQTVPTITMSTDPMVAERELGVRLLRQDPAAALSGAALLEDLATRGDRLSQVIVGRLYLDGEVVRKDQALGARWVRKAAEAGEPFAQYMMANLYKNGIGAPQDDAQAVHWAKSAVDRGFVLANVTLGQLYAEGRGVPADTAQALRHYRSAADKKNAAGMWYLGDVYLEGKGVEADRIVAFAWFDLALANASSQADRAAATRSRSELETVLLPEERAAATKLAAEWHPGDDLALKRRALSRVESQPKHSNVVPVTAGANPALAETSDLPSTRKHLSYDYIVQSDGSNELTIHVEIQPHNQAAAQSLAQQTFNYSQLLDTFELVEAYTLKPDGRRIAVSPSAVHDQLPKEAPSVPMFSDERVKVVLFPDVQSGDTLVYSARYTSKPYLANAFTLAVPMNPAIRDDDVKVRVTAPKTMPLSTETHGMKFDKRAMGDTVVYEWSWNNPKPVAEYLIATAPLDRAPRLFASSFRTYEDLGRAYGALTDPKIAVTERLKAHADQITAGLSDRRRQAEAIYDWVRRNIRYVQVRLGSEGTFEPHDAETVLANGYGDCKDHSALFSALLAAKGIASETVLINYGNSYTLAGPPTFGSLNHAITWVPELKLYADTTAGVAPFGVLPFEEYGKPVVHAIKEGTAVRRTPVLPPDFATVENRVTMKMEKDGRVVGENRAVADGPYAVKLRQMALQVQSLGTEAAAKVVLRNWGIDGSGRFNLDSPYGPGGQYQVTGRFQTLPRPDLVAGNTFRPAPGLVLVGQPGDDLLGPLDMIDRSGEPTPCFSGRQIYEAEVDLPEGKRVRELPKPVEVKTKFMVYRSNWTLNGRKLALRREFAVTVQEPVCIGDLRRQAAKALNDIRADTFANVSLVDG